MQKREKFYPWTFVGSVIWIGFFSYLMNWWTYVIGSTLGIPQVVGILQ
jgi:sodium/potassium/calcium exchanger 2